MSDQPEALFLADVIENDPQSKAHHDAAAACLRRLHAEIERLRADAERYRWLASKARKDTSYDRYGNGALWRIGFFADNGRHAFEPAIDAARAALKEGNDD